MRPFPILAAFAVLVLAIGQADAQVTIGPFPIDGLQEVPPVVTPGIGTGMVTLQPSGMLDFNSNFGGLLAPEIAAHFHGPVPAGMNAGVQIPLPPGSGRAVP